MQPQISIVPAHNGPLLDAARSLFREYSIAIADVAACSLQHQGFEAELAALPGLYAPPRGRIYLALDGDTPAGCIALRPLTKLGPGVCELKRMYVKPDHRGKHIGRLLGEQLITDAREIGYTAMKLDTSTSMHPAIALYTALGFVPCARYNDDPMDDTLWFELHLDSR